MNQNFRVKIGNTRILYIQYYSENVVRLIFSENEQEISFDREWILNPITSIPEKTLNPHDHMKIDGTQISITIDPVMKELFFINSLNSPLFSTKIDSNNTSPCISLSQQFEFSPDDALFGLGQYQTGVLNYRGRKVKLKQENTSIAVPFLVSSRNFGIIWNNASSTEFDSTKNPATFQSECGTQVDFFVMSGENIDELISHYRCLTGTVPLFSKWAYGFWQSRNRYHSQEELLSVVEKFRKLKIPLDVIVLDYYYWGKYNMGSHQFDEANFPDPAEMVRKLHEDYNCKLAISVWPEFVEGSKNYEFMKNRGYLLDLKGNSGLTYDVTNGAAGKAYWGLIEENISRLGIDVWWMDATEPDNTKGFHQTETSSGLGKKNLNLYSLLDTKYVYQGFRAQIEGTDRRSCILTRSGFLGQQKNGTILWSGDIRPTFKSLRTQIPAGLNIGLAGFPYWTTDIGGYWGGNPYSERYREVFIRWFQYGTFCPIFRSHGRRFPTKMKKTPNEPWSYGPKVMGIMKEFIELRYYLLPYIYSLAGQTTLSHYTIMRALVFDFPHDIACHNITDQFMLGPALMICPITTRKQRNKKIYLPKLEGTNLWYDFWTGTSYVGGTTHKFKITLNRIPVFVKAGSIIPTAIPSQYAENQVRNEIILHIYPGNSCEFTFYEDDGCSYQYEKGKYRTTSITWHEKEQKLLISPLHQPDSFSETELRQIYAPEVSFNILIQQGMNNIMKNEYFVTPDQKLEYNSQSVTIYL